MWNGWGVNREYVKTGGGFIHKICTKKYITGVRKTVGMQNRNYIKSKKIHKKRIGHPNSLHILILPATFCFTAPGANFNGLQGPFDVQITTLIML